MQESKHGWKKYAWTFVTVALSNLVFDSIKLLQISTIKLIMQVKQEIWNFPTIVVDFVNCHLILSLCNLTVATVDCSNRADFAKRYYRWTPCSVSIDTLLLDL